MQLRLVIRMLSVCERLPLLSVAKGTMHEISVLITSENFLLAHYLQVYMWTVFKMYVGELSCRI